MTRRLIHRIKRLPTRTANELLVIAAGTAVVMVLLFGPIALSVAPTSGLRGKDRADAINATRQTLLAAGGGLALMVGAAFTARTYHLSRSGQLTDRYTKAVQSLAADRLIERLGAIYALELLMRESGRLHSGVIDVLAAFVRERAPADNVAADQGSQHGGHRPSRPATDVAAALTVLSRRPQRYEQDSLDLSCADLSGASLTGADLQGADLRGARLAGADLSGANLRGTRLQHANLAIDRLGNDAPAEGITVAQLSVAAIDDTTMLPSTIRDALQRRATRT